MIYLDYAANTPIGDVALNTLYEVSKSYIGNPNSNHSEGTRSRSRLNESTKRISDLLGFQPEEIIYTSTASEANNLAVKGIAGKYKRNGKHMITTFLEHSSLNGALIGAQDQGIEVDFVNLDQDGKVNLDHLKELLREDTILVSMSYVDSEVGVIQPINEIGKLLKEYPNCYFHVDATQAIGKIPVDFENVDLVTFTAHKFYGPNGVGALLKRNHVELMPLIEGGISTTIYRSGTPTLALIASMEAALSDTMKQLEENYEYVKELNQYIRTSLKQYGNVKINSPEGASPFILNISFQGIKSRDFNTALNEAGICVSTKSACCPENAISKPVYAVTKSRKLGLSPLRISLSHLTTREEIEEFLGCFDQIYKEMVQH